MFSNLTKITDVSKEHPIENEITSGGRFQLGRNFKKRVNAASEKTKRNPHWRDNVEVEL